MTERGIKVDSEQIKGIKEVQRLIGKLVALGWFISHFTNRL